MVKSGFWVEERYRELALMAYHIADRFHVRFSPRILLALFVLALSCTSTAVVPPDELRAERLNKTIMCPICPGESIDQAGNDLAVQMRGIVREQISDGWGDDRIKQFWIERYGPSVILEPPKEGFGLTAWLMPPVAVVASGLLLWMSLRWMRRSTPDSEGDEAEPQLSQRELSYYRDRIFEALDLEDDTTASTDESEPTAGAKGGS